MAFLKVSVSFGARSNLSYYAKKQQFQDIELLRLIAQNDPETKAMLDEYMSLVG